MQNLCRCWDGIITKSNVQALFWIELHNHVYSPKRKTTCPKNKKNISTKRPSA